MTSIVISSLPPLPNLYGSGIPKGTDLTPATDITDTSVNASGKTNKYTRSAELNFVLTSMGLTTYTAVIAGTIAALTATYDNGASGVGATLTNADAQEALTLDGVTLVVGSRVLIKDQASPAQNGIYVVTTLGTVSTNWVLTRATDYDLAIDVVQYGVVLVNQGTVNAGLLFQESGAGPFTIGTTAITFVAYSILSALTGVESITGTANQVIASASVGPVTLSLPQSIATSSSPTFAELTIDNLNFNGNTIAATNVGGNITLIADGTGNVDIFAPPASEASGINVNGFTFNTAFRINDIGTVSPAQSIIHRHSTTLEPVLLFARANSDTDAHAAVTNGMVLSSTYSTGWTGAQYSLFGQIRISADGTGTISDTSAPGKIELMVSPSGAITPVAALSISNAGVTTLANALPVASGGTGVTTTPTNGQLLIGNGTGYTLANLTAGAGVSISNGSGSITISGTGAGIGWTEVAGASQTMVADNGYVTNNAGVVTLTLPATAAFGTAINIIGKGAGGWAVAQGAGQSIQIGSVSSTVGVGGSIASSNRYDSINLICTTANTVFTAIGGPQGAITIV